MTYPAEPRAPERPVRAGVLLSNLGTPTQPTAGALRPYLREFLGDPRVVEAPRALWWTLLNLVIVPTRSPRSARLYANIWTAEGSPLLAVTRLQARLLEQELERRLGEGVPVVVAMRYGRPSFAEALDTLRELGCRRVLSLPLYPQYSAATVGSSFDALATTLTGWRWVPAVRTVHGYHDHPGYIRALAASVRDYWAAHGEPRRLMISFHGIPLRYAVAGDPYPEQCRATARLLAQELRIPDEQWFLAFQSRFGREEWLTPYADQTLLEWAREGTDGVQVLAPGFAADCLETLEELAITNRELFHEAGGGAYSYIPALNDRPDHIAALADIAEANLGGW